VQWSQNSTGKPRTENRELRIEVVLVLCGLLFLLRLAESIQGVIQVWPEVDFSTLAGRKLPGRDEFQGYFD